MFDVPEHPCETPSEKQATGWTCPMCGQRWFYTVRHTSVDRRIEGWQRMRVSKFDDRGANRNLRDAYELEQVADSLPWTAVIAKRQARSRARSLRRLEGQK